MKLKRAKFIKTKKNVKANVFEFRKDEVIWINDKKLVRDYIKHSGVASIVPVVDKKNILSVNNWNKMFKFEKVFMVCLLVCAKISSTIIDNINLQGLLSDKSIRTHNLLDNNLWNKGLYYEYY